MAFAIPDSVLRLQAQAFVSDAELGRIGRAKIIGHAKRQQAEIAVRHIMDRCIRTEDYPGFIGQTLRLDVYVLSPQELNSIIAEALTAGRKDAMYWGDLAARGEKGVQGGLE